MSEESVLARSVKLRMPNFDEYDTAKSRADKLADHILDTARMRGELADLRMRAHVELKGAMVKWRALEGWERYKARSSDRSKQAEDDAKRRHSPELAQLIDDATFTIKRATEEMDRLGGSDYDAASRAYTILTGG